MNILSTKCKVVYGIIHLCKSTFYAIEAPLDASAADDYTWLYDVIQYFAIYVYSFLGGAVGEMYGL